MYNPVTGLKATARYSQIDVTWDAQPDAPSFWVRAFIGTKQVRWETVCAPANSITLRNMDQGTTYRISCWAGLSGPGNNVSVMATTKGVKPATEMAAVATTVPCPDVPPVTGPPDVTTGNASGITSSGATLNGAVNPSSLDTSSHFNYGDTNAYGAATPNTSSGAGSTIVPVSAVLTGLQPASTYHFQLEAANSAGDVKGLDAAFTTLAVTPPGGTNFAANPSAHGYPDVTNTGAILAPLTNLQPGVSASGSGWAWNGDSLTISGSGITFQNYSVPGQVFVNGTNVTMRNCKVLANNFQGNGITVGGAGYLLDHCTVSGSNALNGGLDAGIKGKGGNTIEGTIQWCNIYYSRSGIQDVAGLAESNYIHDLRHASGDHINGFTQNGGTDPLIIRHNTIFNSYSQTDAVGLFGDFGKEGNDTVTDNILAGGGYTVYGGAGASGGDPVNVKITNNRISNKYFAEGGYWGWIAYAGSAGNGNVVSGNIWDATGRLI